MTTIIGLILGNKFVLMLVAGVVAVAGAWFKGRSGGIKRERDRQARATLHNIETRDDVEDAIAGRTDAEKREELGKWVK